MAAGSPNAELIREGFAAFSERRFDDCLATLDPEVEWHIAFRLPDLPPDLTVVRGHAEVRQLWDQFTAAWESLTFEPERILYDDGERVIARIRVHGVGVGSGVEVDRTIIYLAAVRDGMLRRIVPHDSPEEAAAAAGIDPAQLR